MSVTPYVIGSLYKEAAWLHRYIYIHWAFSPLFLMQIDQSKPHRCKKKKSRTAHYNLMMSDSIYVKGDLAISFIINTLMYMNNS